MRVSMVVHLLQNYVEKKIFFFWENMFFTKYTLFAEKNVFIWNKKVLHWKFFLLKKTFFTEKNINENVKIYISFEKYIFMQKMFVLQIKYKYFLNIYSFLLTKNIFVKTSLWTQQSGP